jgi:thymidylate synthase
MMNNLDKQYQALLQDILDNGVEKKDRTGTGTFSVFGRQIRHKMSDGFPLLTTKKVHFKSVIAELLWFLRGETNIKSLLTYGCNIWNGDAYKNYSSKVETWEPHLDEEMFIERIKTDDEFANKWGSLGKIYGAQWRKWDKYEHQNIDKRGFPNVKTNVDQIANLINELKTNPDSRRLMVNAWNVGELDQMVLPPCHYGFQVYTRELTHSEHLEFLQNNPESWGDLDNNPIPQRKISLIWNQRSVDTFLGLPFNIASYGLLLEIIAKEVNMIPDELIGNLGDTHLYSNHIEQAKEQISREPYPLPTFKLQHIEKDYTGMVYELENYKSHPTIKAPLSN